MCGRYGSWSSDTALAERFGVDDAADPSALPGLPASWNLAPGADVRVVVERVPRGARDAQEAQEADGTGTALSPAPSAPVRRLDVARWGLLASWAKDPRAAFRAFNARSETAAEKPTFRAAMRSFRAVVPADCWYEWQRPALGADGERLSRAQADRLKRPFAVSREDGEPLALAGLCSWWRVPGTGAEGGPGAGGSAESPADLADDAGRPAVALALPPGVRPGPAIHGSWLLTCSILTRAARADLDWLHDREPVVLDDAAVDAWLDPECRDPQDAAALLEGTRPALRWWEVGPEVGSPRAEGPSLLTARSATPRVSQA